MMNAVSARLEQRLGNGLGMVITVALHVLAILFLLDSRQQIEVPATPLMARVISEQASQQQPETIVSRPTLDRPQLRVPQPELVIADVAPRGMAPAATTQAAAAAASTTTTQVARETQPRFDADYLNNPPPEYPRVSRRLREQGVVMLRVYVLPNGLPEVVELKASSGSARLDESALDAVRRWKFVPAQASGRAVGAWVIVPIEFTLNA
jgi:protein TonB